MGKTQRVLLLLQIFCTVLLGSLQFIDPNRLEKTQDGILRHGLGFLYSNNLIISVICGLIIAVTTTAKDIYLPRKQQRAWRQSVMEAMMSDCFNGNKREVRITLFRDRQPIYCAWKYFVRLVKHYSRWRRWRKPRPRIGRYVYAKERYGTEFPNSRTTFFYSPETKADCEGIVSVVRQSLVRMVVHDLPDIQNVNLNSFNYDSNSNEAKRVKKYMRGCHIKDLETLKGLHWRAKHLYGDILVDNENKVQGVLVIDSWQTDSPFTDNVLPRLAHYIKLFSVTM